MTTKDRSRSRERPRVPQRDPQRETAAQLIADIIHHKVETVKQEKAAVVAAVTRRRRRGKLWYFLFALPLLVGLTLWNIVRTANPPEVFTADERESGLRFRMYLAAQAVEAYRDSVGRWPPDLKTVGFGEAGFSYRTGERGFEIGDTASSSMPLTYQRGDPLSPFAGAYYELQRGGTP